MMTDETNPWTLYFVGVSWNDNQARAGIVLENSFGNCTLYHKELDCHLMFKYAALIFNLKIGKGKSIMKLNVLGDSKFVCKQASRDWQVKLLYLQPYHQTVEKLKTNFKI